VQNSNSYGLFIRLELQPPGVEIANLKGGGNTVWVKGRVG